MPICKKCNNHFPFRIKIDGKIRNLNNRKYCLTCSPFGQHNTKPLHLRDITKKDGKYICVRCNKKYIHKLHKNTKRLCNSCMVTRTRINKKRKCVDYKGGKCEKCGYNKCLSSLHFHHIDESNKSFSISSNYCRSWKTIKAELDKTILVCANCHGEIHHEQNVYFD